MEIIYKSQNLVIINKPVGIPSQPDLTGDADAMTLTEQTLILLGEPSSLWLVHRLDRAVGGLMVFARNKSCASYLSSLIQERKLNKEYLAVCEGECLGEGEMRDFIFNDSKLSKAFIVDRARGGVKEALLSYKSVARKSTERGAVSLVRVSLHTGRYHQIRAQFASRKMPLVGDGKYGSRDSIARTPALFSHRLAFEIPGESVEVCCLPCKDIYPWNLWSDEL